MGIPNKKKQITHLRISHHLLNRVLLCERDGNLGYIERRPAQISVNNLL